MYTSTDIPRDILSEVSSWVIVNITAINGTTVIAFTAYAHLELHFFGKLKLYKSHCNCTGLSHNVHFLK